jgi:hypothetical protein
MVLSTDRLITDDDSYEKAKVALHMIHAILADLPPRWQLAIVKALCARMVVLRELQREQPLERPTLSA